MHPLQPYRSRRHFELSHEPRGRRRATRREPTFVVQKHRAQQLHYDFRLEVDGVLRSWAVPKGPSLRPSDKRMAVAVEDHPIEYADFEGIIPEGEYGGGTVMVWDRGTYEVHDGLDVAAALQRGRLRLVLKGHKLEGAWALVRIRSRTWLLVKRSDSFASREDVARAQPRSVASGRLLAEIAADEGGDVTKAATGDPPASRRATPPAPRLRKARARP